MSKEVSHFWVGAFESKSAFDNFFGEASNYYEDERDVTEKYISEFAKSQNENWFDHDFFECGFEEDKTSIENRFSKYSYSQQWLNELKKRINELQPDFQINSIAFINKNGIANPKSVKAEKIELLYLGTIEYVI